MSTYDVDFGGKLADTAKSIASNGINDPAAKRVVIYLGLLSAEISLKAMLEQAGVAVSKIRRRGHDLSGLLDDLGKCKVRVDIVPGVPRLVPAARLRAVAIKQGRSEITVGKVIKSEQDGASKYPNSIRYGNHLRHYPAMVVADMACAVSCFARVNWSSLKS